MARARKRSTAKVAVINGPNLNLLGKRDTKTYGTVTLKEIRQRVEKLAKELGVEVLFQQTNSEGELVETIQHALHECQGIVINPAAYTHTSIAIRDALEVATIPVVEVHLSNIFRREEFRHHSFVSGVATGVICGLGADGYELALEAIARRLKKKS